MPGERVFLSLGSNLGDRRKYLKEALNKIAKLDKTQLLSLSSLYETAAWGREDQDDFYNMALLITTKLEPLELLDELQRIEGELERVRELHWGPRTMDIDILLYGDRIIDHERLKVPHPYMTSRRFVLEPLQEIAPSLKIYGRELEAYLQENLDEKVERIGKIF